ncbi:MAG: cation transporter [Oscillospiraceae bacterium]|nr:cation transporter [Oscillospiraceae bacterium]
MAKSQDRLASGRMAGLVGIISNVALFAAKLTVGSLSGSVSITADAMNNLSDASSSVVTLLGFKLAEKPADEDHPYGHARFEYLSGLAVAVLILFIGFELAKSSVVKIIHPTAVKFTWLTAGVLVGSMAVKLWLSIFNRRLGKKIGSDTLLATAADSRNDVIATGAVLLSGSIQALTGANIDGLMGLGVALFILYSGVGLARDTVSPLLGEAAGPELREQILDQIRFAPQVLGYHDLMVHDYGPGRRFASIHVEMDCRADPLLCHEIIDNLERECYESHGIHLVIHYDPVITDDPELTAAKQMVLAHLDTIDSRLTVHDFRMVRSPGHTNLIFDIALPADLTGKEKEIKKRLDQKLNQSGNTTYYTVITFDPEAFNR